MGLTENLCQISDVFGLKCGPDRNTKGAVAPSPRFVTCSRFTAPSFTTPPLVGSPSATPRETISTTDRHSNRRNYSQCGARTGFHVGNNINSDRYKLRYKGDGWWIWNSRWLSSRRRGWQKAGKVIYGISLNFRHKDDQFFWLLGTIWLNCQLGCVKK